MSGLLKYDISNNFAFLCLLQSLDLSSSYCNMLCNVYEVQMALKTSGQSSSPTADISEYLSSALKSLDAHKAKPLVHPPLARVLFLSGDAHAHARDAVTAEGLRRSALDKLDTLGPVSASGGMGVASSGGPSGLSDVRIEYERARVLHVYGNLLLKWDKREKMGRNMLTQSEALLQTMQRLRSAGGSSGSDSTIPVSQSITFPTEFV